MRIYIATRLTNQAAHGVLARGLEADGHVLTHDWTGCEVAPKPEWFQNADGTINRQRMEACGTADARGARDCDALIALLPAGGGTHFEMGIAHGAGKPVLILGREPDYLNPYPNALHYSLLDRGVTRGYVNDLDQALALARLWLRVVEAGTPIGHELRLVPVEGKKDIAEVVRA